MSMTGKYKNWPQLIRAYGIRESVRVRLNRVVSWDPLTDAKPGCTAVIGMCHRLPDVLLGNVRCLVNAAWPELSEIIIVVDGVRGCIDAELERSAIALGGRINVRVEYYTAAQNNLAEALKLPYVFAWLSWSIGFSQCLTRHALIHDYDALVFGDALSRRYAEFASSQASIQGIRWYAGNGVEPEDKLATTFEAFVDVPWLRSHAPSTSFHKVRYRDGRSFDYDTLLDLQHNFTPVEQRTIMHMDEEEMVHPSQMIHQYTMFRRHPGKQLPCYSIPMIPFFEYFSGSREAIAQVLERVDKRQGAIVDFVGDGTQVHTGALLSTQVDWALKQMVRACQKSGIPPFADLYRYGERLYGLTGAPESKIWLGDFTQDQRAWIEQSRNQAAS